MCQNFEYQLRKIMECRADIIVSYFKMLILVTQYGIISEQVNEENGQSHFLTGVNGSDLQGLCLLDQPSGTEVETQRQKMESFLQLETFKNEKKKERKKEQWEEEKYERMRGREIRYTPHINGPLNNLSE